MISLFDKRDRTRRARVEYMKKGSDGYFKIEDQFSCTFMGRSGNSKMPQSNDCLRLREATCLDMLLGRTILTDDRGFRYTLIGIERPNFSSGEYKAELPKPDE